MSHNARAVPKPPDVNSSISSAGVGSDLSLPTTPRHPSLHRRDLSPPTVTYPAPPDAVVPRPRVHNPYTVLTMTEVAAAAAVSDCEPFDLYGGGRSPSSPGALSFARPPRGGAHSFDGTADDSAATQAAAAAFLGASHTTLPHGATPCLDAAAAAAVAAAAAAAPRAVSPLETWSPTLLPLPAAGGAGALFPTSPPPAQSLAVSPFSEHCGSPTIAREIPAGKWPIPPPPPPGADGGGPARGPVGGAAGERGGGVRRGRRRSQRERAVSPLDDVTVSARRSPLTPGTPGSPATPGGTVHTTVAAVKLMYYNGRPIPTSTTPKTTSPVP